MKKYRFEFDKFVKDLEERADKNRKHLTEELQASEEAEIKRARVRRYQEHPHNSIVYKREQKNDR